MKAPVDDQRALLRIQQLDREVAKLMHARDSMPAASHIASLRRDIEARRRERVEAETAAQDHHREVSKLETDLAQVRSRLRVQSDRLTAGQGSPKELESLQSEIGQIEARIEDLETEQLEALEAEEAARERAAQAESARSEAEAQIASIEAEAGTQVGAIEEQVKQILQERTSEASGVDPDLLALYDRVRANTGGIGAVAVHGRRVEGMPIELSLAEAEELRAASPDDVIQSEEYDVIYVRVED